jgi:hypothetical protein
MLLHCPVAFERDHPQAGEAEIIVAKHSASPCRTITVASQLHLNRFSNIARGGYGGSVWLLKFNVLDSCSRRLLAGAACWMITCSNEDPGHSGGTGKPEQFARNDSQSHRVTAASGS